MNRREMQRLVGLMVSTGALDTATGKVDVDKMRGSWSIEDGGRRWVKITRSKGAGADDNQGGKQSGDNGGADAGRR